MWSFHPMKTPKGDGVTVIFWTVIVIVVGFGIVCLFYGFGAPTDKAEEASKLIRGGFGFIAFGIVACLVRKYFTGY